MRILLVSHLFLPTYNAGTETYTLSLAKNLARRGHATTVVCADPWGVGATHWNGMKQDIVENVPVRRLGINWLKAEDPNLSLYDNARVEKWFDEMLRKDRPDVVHVTSIATLGAGVLRAVHRTRTPLVLSLMDFWFLCPSTQLLQSNGDVCSGAVKAWDCHSCLGSRSGIFRVINRFLPEAFQPHFWSVVSRFPSLTKRRGLRGMLLNVPNRRRVLKDALGLPDRVVSHSEFLRQVFESNGAHGIRVIRAGHDLTWAVGYQRRHAEHLRFGYLGQIEALKGVHVLIEAFRSLGGAPASLEIWGDLSRSPDYVKRLRELAGNDPRVAFKGRFERAKLGSVLSGIDVLVVPSLWYENWPLVIQEAFAVGAPVVATDLGGMREAITHGVNGLLFKRGSVSDLVCQLRRLLVEPDLLPALRLGIPPVRTAEEEAADIDALYGELTGPAQCQPVSENEV